MIQKALVDFENQEVWVGVMKIMRIDEIREMEKDCKELLILLGYEKPKSKWFR